MYHNHAGVEIKGVKWLQRELTQKYTTARLKELQDKPLEDKIALSKLRITEFYEHYNGNVIVSFSGGKDSTVLLHLVRSLYPEVKAVYCDTGLEFPEVKDHVKQVDNVEIIRPKLSFKEVLDKYGWLFPSKDVAEKIYFAKLGSLWAKNAMKGLDVQGQPTTFKKRYKKWEYLVDSPFKFSHKCCTIMKKKPFSDYVRLNGGVHTLAH